MLQGRTAAVNLYRVNIPDSVAICFSYISIQINEIIYLMPCGSYLSSSTQARFTFLQMYILLLLQSFVKNFATLGCPPPPPPPPPPLQCSWYVGQLVCLYVCMFVSVF